MTLSASVTSTDQAPVVERPVDVVVAVGRKICREYVLQRIAAGLDTLKEPAAVLWKSDSGRAGSNPNPTARLAVEINGYALNHSSLKSETELVARAMRHVADLRQMAWDNPAQKGDYVVDSSAFDKAAKEFELAERCAHRNFRPRLDYVAYLSSLVTQHCSFNVNAHPRCLQASADFAVGLFSIISNAFNTARNDLEMAIWRDLQSSFTGERPSLGPHTLKASSGLMQPRAPVHCKVSAKGQVEFSLLLPPTSMGYVELFQKRLDAETRSIVALGKAPSLPGFGCVVDSTPGRFGSVFGKIVTLTFRLPVWPDKSANPAFEVSKEPITPPPFQTFVRRAPGGQDRPARKYEVVVDSVALTETFARSVLERTLTASDTFSVGASEVARVAVFADGAGCELGEWKSGTPQVLITSANSSAVRRVTPICSASELRLVAGPNPQTWVYIPNTQLLQDPGNLAALTKLFSDTRFLEVRNVDTDWLSGENSLLAALNKFVDALKVKGHEMPSLIVQKSRDYFACLALSEAGEPITSIIHK